MEKAPPKTRVVNIWKESFDIYIGRPSPWGNPFHIGRDGTREEVISKFRRYLSNSPLLVGRGRKVLKGKVLGCFCPPLPCHGDVWVEVLKGK